MGSPAFPTNGNPVWLNPRNRSPLRNPSGGETPTQTGYLFVGLPRFELGTFGPPDRRANQAAPQPAVERSLYRRGPAAGPAGSGQVTSIQMPCTRRQPR